MLQLRTMMWFAWQSCSKKELELNEDENSLGGQLVKAGGGRRDA